MNLDEKVVNLNWGAAVGLFAAASVRPSLEDGSGPLGWSLIITQLSSQHPAPPHPLTASLAGSIMCECERRPPIKSHLKASLSPCASCVPCSLSSTSRRRRRHCPAPPAWTPSASSHPTFMFYCISGVLICACEHVLTFCVCTLKTSLRAIRGRK